MHSGKALDTAMEKSPSWSRAHDWKSCRLLKGLEGSNPSFSATQNPVISRVMFIGTQCDLWGKPDGTGYEKSKSREFPSTYFFFDPKFI